MTSHQQLMSDYYAAREAQEQRAESYSAGYDSEANTFYSEVEHKITFKEWLTHSRKDEAA